MPFYAILSHALMVICEGKHHHHDIISLQSIITLYLSKGQRCKHCVVITFTMGDVFMGMLTYFAIYLFVFWY